LEWWKNGIMGGQRFSIHYSTIPSFQFVCCIVTQKKEKFETASSLRLGWQPSRRVSGFSYFDIRPAMG